MSFDWHVINNTESMHFIPPRNSFHIMGFSPEDAYAQAIVELAEASERVVSKVEMDELRSVYEAVSGERVVHGEDSELRHSETLHSYARKFKERIVKDIVGGYALYLGFGRNAPEGTWGRLRVELTDVFSEMALNLKRSASMEEPNEAVVTRKLADQALVVARGIWDQILNYSSLVKLAKIASWTRIPHLKNAAFGLIYLNPWVDGEARTTGSAYNDLYKFISAGHKVNHWDEKLKNYYSRLAPGNGCGICAGSVFLKDIVNTFTPHPFIKDSELMKFLFGVPVAPRKEYRDYRFFRRIQMLLLITRNNSYDILLANEEYELIRKFMTTEGYLGRGLTDLLVHTAARLSSQGKLVGASRDLILMAMETAKSISQSTVELAQKAGAHFREVALARQAVSSETDRETELKHDGMELMQEVRGEFARTTRFALIIDSLMDPAEEQVRFDAKSAEQYLAEYISVRTALREVDPSPSSSSPPSGPSGTQAPAGGSTGGAEAAAVLNAPAVFSAGVMPAGMQITAGGVLMASAASMPAMIMPVIA